MNYEDFLRSKQKQKEDCGFKPKQLNKHLFPFQAFIVDRALQAGKYAVFADCGLGKTIIQLEWAHQVCLHTNQPVLILCPLAVAGQTIAEGEKFGIKVHKWENLRSVKREKDCMDNYPHKPSIYIINYEQLENIKCDVFAGIVLDESSILKNFDGKTKKRIIHEFKKTKYKLACTATPSPNDPMEIGNHSEFLDVMKRNQMLSMFFVHDGGETAKWRIKGHAESIFYDWVSTWAVMLSRPQDIGFEMDGFDLPDLNFIEKTINTENKGDRLFNDVAVSATNFNSELRLTKLQRIEESAKIINDSDETFIIWTKQNEEGLLVKKLVPDSVEVKGSDNPKYKEEKLLGFAKGEFRVLNTKTKIAQFGLNYQHCHNQVFPSLDFSFEGLYQAIRRSYRFGQTLPVNIYIITTDTMQNVIKSIKDKEQKFKAMQNKMTIAVSENITNKKELNINSVMDYQDDCSKVLLGDCVKRIKELDNDVSDLTIFSPPFSDLYTYSDSLEDMGNSKDFDEFMVHFGYLVPELSRTLKPGRLSIVHCMDLPIQKGKEGYIGLRDFSGMLIQMFQSRGFILHSKVTIWKDPVIEMQRTKALGLLHKQLKKDSIKSRVGIPDYLLIFKNKGDNEIPVKQAIPVDLWQKWASPVWYDINYSNTLQFRNAREEKDERHICPLQLDTIERCIALWSNEGETIFSPFGGIGSEGFQALKMNRKSISIELKQSYFEVNVKNHQAAKEGKNQLQLFA